LKEFRHEHPTFNAGLWSVETNLSVNGKYWIWAQGKILADGEEFAAEERFKVQNGTKENPTPPVLGDVRKGTDGTSQIELANTVLKAKKMAMPNLTFTRTDTTSLKLEDYLGQPAHMIIVNSKGDELLHVHPMTTSKPEVMMLHTTFPAAGDYRVWVQFIDDGSLKTIPLSVTVKP